MKLYDHLRTDYTTGNYRFILANRHGHGILFRKEHKDNIFIKFSKAYVGLSKSYISKVELVIETNSPYQKNLFLDNNGNIIVKANKNDWLYLKDITLFKGDISDLKPFNKRLILKNK